MLKKLVMVVAMISMMIGAVSPLMSKAPDKTQAQKIGYEVLSAELSQGPIHGPLP